MAKIIKVTDVEVKIAKDDGGYLDVDKTSLNFLPEVGQVVEVHEIDDEIIVNQVKEDSQEKININIDNTNTSANTNVQNQGSTTYITVRPVKKWTYVLLALFLGMPATLVRVDLSAFLLDGYAGYFRIFQRNISRNTSQ